MDRMNRFTCFLLLCSSLLSMVRYAQGQEKTLPNLKSAVLAGGCFWCVESDLEKAPGVVNVVAGYTGGKSANPTYKTYASRGHREAVLVTYDLSKITFAGLLEYFIKHIDPIDKGGSFVDRGKGYAPAIYVANEEERAIAKQVIDYIDDMKVYKNRITLPVLDRSTFYPAEDYHQNYHTANPLAYGTYRRTCGRDAFVRKVWGDKLDVLTFPGAFPESVADSNETGMKVRNLEGKKSGSQGQDQGPKGASAEDERSAHAKKWSEYKKPDAETLRRKLPRLSYRVTQSSETEPAFRNALWDHHESGLYVDIVSGEPLFASFDKFDSGTGWPSFVKPIDPRHVLYEEDRSEGMVRIEVRSKYADSHLGHVFTDGPPARGGMRFCINSAALRFIPVEKLKEEGYEEFIPLFPSPAK